MIWLVRHGAADWPPGLALGWSDPPLSPRGVREAEGAATALASRILEAVHSSDLRRAAETATLVARPHGLAPTLSRDLRELDFGAWEGRPLSALWREQPEQARAWEADLRRTPPSFGEPATTLEARAARFAAGLRAAPRGEVAVVAHRGSLAALEAALTGTELAATFRDGLAQGQVRRLDVPC